jgi:membrane protein
MTQKLHKRVLNRLRQTWRFWRYVGLRFWDDNLFTKSAALSFQTALALVPLFTITISVLSAFPGFQDEVQHFQASILDVVAPHVGIEIGQQLTLFVDNARKLTAVGIIVLAFIAMMLLHTASDTFDEIFRIKRQRGLAIRFMAYWTLLTLGPLLFAVGFSLTAGIVVSEPAGSADFVDELVVFLRNLLPFFIEWIAFMFIYWLAPSKPGEFSDAAAAALVAAILMQVLKGGFALYLLYVASYESIYGAVAAIPVALIWLELAWAAALFGASIAAGLPEWRGGLDLPRAALEHRKTHQHH